jgi:hypothetical protein
MSDNNRSSGSLLPFGEYRGDEFILSPLAKDTERGWRHIKELCDRQVSIGFGALDSFLSGPDLERRISLVEAEANSNEWLRRELQDTLTLNQSSDWNEDQHRRLTLVSVSGRSGPERKKE